MKYIKGFDVLRALAVLLVIRQHWGPNNVKSQWLTFIFNHIVPDGRLGVDLFFVLSGYLITKILLDARNRDFPEKKINIIKVFYLRRILRIFPIYFLIVFIIAFIFSDAYAKSNILYFVTYTSNFLFLSKPAFTNLGHTWSLAVEEQFYLIWPWIIIYTPKKHLLGCIFFCIGLGIISSLILFNLYGDISFLLLPACLTALASGALYAYIQIHEKFEKHMIRIILVLLPVCITLLFVHQIVHKLILIRAINSVIGLALIIYISKEKYNSVSAFIFNNKFLINIGKISYGIYLLHLPLITYYSQFIQFLQQKQVSHERLFKILTYVPIAYFVMFICLLIISSLSYKFIETPFLKLKRYFMYTNFKTHIPKPISDNA